jgi:hypothetical protein
MKNRNKSTTIIQNSYNLFEVFFNFFTALTYMVGGNKNPLAKAKGFLGESIFTNKPGS